MMSLDRRWESEDAPGKLLQYEHLGPAVRRSAAAC